MTEGFVVISGTVEYGRTIRPADFESKSASVAWTYNLAEGSNENTVTSLLLERARAVVEEKLGLALPGTVELQEKPVQRRRSAPRQEAVPAPSVEEPNDPLDDLGGGSTADGIDATVEALEAEASDTEITGQMIEKEGQAAGARLRKAGKSMQPLRDLLAKYETARLKETAPDKRAALLADLKALS